MHARTSQTAEDYLKAIYEITRGVARASTSAIAEKMDVTPASVTGMIQKLAGAHPPLLNYEKHRGAELTLEGEQVALEIIRHHRLLETFLHEILGFTWDEVHDEADHLEHVISEQMEERIAQALGDPSVDPHGDPIPNRELRMPDQSKVNLDELHPGDQAMVVQIKSSNPELLRYLASIGLTLYSRVSIIDVSPFDSNMVIQIDGTKERFVLGTRVTGKIYVELTDPTILRLPGAT